MQTIDEMLADAITDGKQALMVAALMMREPIEALIEFGKAGAAMGNVCREYALKASE